MPIIVNISKCSLVDTCNYDIKAYLFLCSYIVLFFSCHLFFLRDSLNRVVSCHNRESPNEQHRKNQPNASQGLLGHCNLSNNFFSLKFIDFSYKNGQCQNSNRNKCKMRSMKSHYSTV